MGLTLTPGVRNLLSYWGSISNAASNSLGVAGAWDALRDALGISQGTSVKGFASIQDMNAVYALAAGNRQAAATFAAAGPDAAITGAMIGATPNSREANLQEAAPLYNVRVSYTYTTTGTPQSDWVTVQLPQSLEGMTVGALTDLVTTLATTIITGYGITTVSYTSLAITAA